MIDFTSYEFMRGKRPAGRDSYTIEINLKNGRAFEISKFGDYAEIIAEIITKYGDQIKKIYIGV